MPTNYPASLDAYPDPAGGVTQGSTTPTHSGHHQNHNDAIEAIEAKLGTGAGAAAANTVLRGTGTGTTGYGQIQGADVGAGQIATVHLAANAATQTVVAAGSSAFSATGASVWAYDSAGAPITVTLTDTATVTLIATGSYFANAAAANARFGIVRVGQPAPPSSMLVHFINASVALPVTVQYTETLAAGTHAFWLGLQCVAGGYVTQWSGDGSRLMVALVSIR